MRVSTDGQTHTHAQTQNEFIICPMLYAIAMGQIITDRFFRYANCLWNQLPLFLRQPYFGTSSFSFISDSTFSSPPLLPLLIHHSGHPQLPLSFTPGLKRNSFTNPTPVFSLLPSGLPSRTIAWTISFKLLCFHLFFP